MKGRPDDPLAHSQLGSSYLHLGQLDMAEEHLKQAILLEAGHFSFPHLKLAQVYSRKSNPAAAMQQLEEFLRLHPDAPQAPDVRKILEANRARPKP